MTEPFDELFIAAGMDSALPWTRKREVSSAPLADLNVRVPVFQFVSVHLQNNRSSESKLPKQFQIIKFV